MANDTLGWQALVIPKNPIEFWAVASVLVTLVLAVLAFRGLNSLVLSKKDMLNRAKRDSVRYAIDRCNEMAVTLLPLHLEILEALAATKVPVFVGEPSQVSFEAGEEARKINAALDWTRKLDADERVAFEPCSTAFCQVVMSLYPALLAQRRANPASGPYQNVVTLFNGWYAKKAQAPMLEHLRRLQSDGAKLPPPIGTSLD